MSGRQGLTALGTILLVFIIIGLVAALRLDWTGADARAAAEMVAAADGYRARGGTARSSARFLYRETVRRYPGTIGALEAKIKNAVFYRFNPWDKRGPIARPYTGPLVVVPLPQAVPEKTNVPRPASE